jgi:hypothetical protein
MKDIYKQKLNRMKKGGNYRDVAEFFANNEGDVITAAMIQDNVRNISGRIDTVVSHLRARGWRIDNISENGHPAKWILRGVGDRKSSTRVMVKPVLNPLIESVFC